MTSGVVTVNVARPLSAGNWIARSTGPGVVWRHNFESDAEVTNHTTSYDQLTTPIRMRRAVDPTGITCLEQIVLGGELAADFKAGDTSMTLKDATYWPDPGTDGPFYFMVAKQYPTASNGSTGDKNLFRCTARAGLTLTVVHHPLPGVSAFSPHVQHDYKVGDYAGNDAGDWRRTFAALPAGENGLATDDPGANGSVPLRSRFAGNAHSVPRDLSLWQYGFYGHPANQEIWKDWTPWQPTPITPRGVSQGAAPKYRLWDGDEFFLQWRIKIDPRFWGSHQQPNILETGFWGRKLWALQSELSCLHQLVTGIFPSNLYAIPSTNPNPVTLLTHKASRIIGSSDYPRARPSVQPGSPWDVAPHYADLSSSFKPSTGCPTPDGSACWEMKDYEWVTFYLRVKPGRSGIRETEIDLKFARTQDPAYTGSYTTLIALTDACIVYSGSGDYDYPAGAFTRAEVPVMNVLPGYQAFGLMGYFNTFQTVGTPPHKASYYVRMAQVIFSKAPIAPPTAE